MKPKKNTGKSNSSKKTTARKNEPSAENTFKEMKRLGIKSVDEYIKHIDKKRGY